MKLIQDPKEMQKTLGALRAEGRTVGFIPTMGALHEGHLSLIKRSKSENDVTVLSIFVNPTQFNHSEDFQKYPKTLSHDLSLVENLDIDFVFNPQYSSLYPDDYAYAVTEKDKNDRLCGASRPGHFQGVLTVVMKLLNIINPHHLYLGEKDFQQLEILKGMAEAFFIPVEIVACPTVRDEEGLALSSRNARLSPKGLEKARFFAKVLKTSRSPSEAREKLQAKGIKVDYLEELWGRKFGAVFIDDVRLIDNVPLV